MDRSWIDGFMKTSIEPRPASLSDSRFPTGFGHQRIPEAFAPVSLVDPNLTQLANSAPSVTSNRADEFALHLREKPERSRVLFAH